MRFTLFSVGRVPSLSDVSELASRLGFHGDKDEFRKASWEYCEETLIGRGSAFKQSPSIFLVICDGTLIMIHTHHINCCNGQLHQHCTADQVPHCAGLKERERERVRTSTVDVNILDRTISRNYIPHTYFFQINLKQEKAFKLGTYV